MTLIQRLAFYALNASAPDAGAMLRARAAITDTVGCMLAGMRECSVRAAVAWAKKNASCSQATPLAGSGFQTDVHTAAMIDAMAAYACDFDDMCNAGCGHPSLPVLPVAIALSQWAGVDGDATLRAYIRGVEISALVGRGFQGSSLSLCFNPTTICGGFGAVAAAAILLSLSEQQTASALAMVSCEAGGTKENYGTPAKDVSAGLLCARAIMCAQLALEGVSASAQALEAPNGLLSAIAPDYRMQAVIDALDRGVSIFEEPGIIPKPYPCCRSNHNAVDGMLSIRKEYGVTAEMVERIICRIDAPSLALDACHMPRTPEEGKFSTAYCVALALLNGALTLADFTGECIPDQRVFEVVQKISVERDDSFANAHFGNEIEVRLTDGRRYLYRGEHAKGDRQNPMTPGEMKSKFLTCAGRYLSPEKADQLYRALSENEQMPNAQALATLIHSVQDEC